MDKVSTVIPTYKRADLLKRAVDSVLYQTYKNIEVLVVDDNNPLTEHRVKTESIMSEYNNNERVKYIKHDKNKNGNAARNTGIANATGKYICFLDDDNYFYPEKIEKQVNYLKEHPELKAVYCGMRRNNKLVIPKKSGNLMFEQLMGTNIIDTNVILIERSIIKQFGGWDERLTRNQDASFMVRFFSLGEKIGAISEELVLVDLIDRSNSAKNDVFKKNLDNFLKYHENEIRICEKYKRGARKNIYCYRYRSALLNYLKNKNYKGAIKLYFNMFKEYPVTFNTFMFSAVVKKIKKQPLNI